MQVARYICPCMQDTFARARNATIGYLVYTFARARTQPKGYCSATRPSARRYGILNYIQLKFVTVIRISNRACRTYIFLQNFGLDLLRFRLQIMLQVYVLVVVCKLILLARRWGILYSCMQKMFQKFDVATFPNVLNFRMKIDHSILDYHVINFNTFSR